ncbi:MAG TPA: glycosyltransferase family 2 protein [Geobacteraceae bacterium]
MSTQRIAAVILNYNSEKDIQVCAEQIARQLNVRLSIIIVDNASRPESLDAVRSWLAEWRPNAVRGTAEEVLTWVRQNAALAAESGRVYLIENHENRGYSAGNNIGIRLADALGTVGVLIANPDMRIEDQHYLKELSRHLFADPLNFVAASRIIALQGNDQNPLREATFWEELFWPRWYLRRFFKQISYILSINEDKPIPVPKVSGCCMLLRMDFLRQIGYLDENVFLYCEEPILSARVHAAKGKILYVPTVTAVHAHVSSEKGNSASRMLQFIKSRKYYLKTYSSYSRWQLGLLSASYAVLKTYNRVRGGGR